MSFETPVGRISTLTEGEEDPWDQTLYHSGDPDVMNVMPDMKNTVYLALTAYCMQLGTSLTDSLDRKTHLPGRLTCPMPRQTQLLYTQVLYKKGASWSYVQKPAETQTINRLASSLSRAPKSCSIGHEF
jgi:hypothetical protein